MLVRGVTESDSCALEFLNLSGAIASVLCVTLAAVNGRPQRTVEFLFKAFIFIVAEHATPQHIHTGRPTRLTFTF